MGRERDINGIRRLWNTRVKTNISHLYVPFKKEETSEDTIIRRDINKTIMDMIQEKKGRVEIEIYLTNKYPNYSEYILKMISHRFDKQNSNKDKDTNLGER